MTQQHSLKALEEKCKKLIEEGERLREAQEAFLKQLCELMSEVESLREKQRMHESNWAQ